jgi:hypothetical protein
MGGTARTVKMEVGDAIKTYDVSDIATLQFTPGSTTSSAGKEQKAPAASKTPGRI